MLKVAWNNRQRRYAFYCWISGPLFRNSHGQRGVLVGHQKGHCDNQSRERYTSQAVSVFSQREYLSLIKEWTFASDTPALPKIIKLLLNDILFERCAEKLAPFITSTFFFPPLICLYSFIIISFYLKIHLDFKLEDGKTWVQMYHGRCNK